MRLVNTRRITLNFACKDVGPSGLASVELWYTPDCLKWKKYTLTNETTHAYAVEMDDEGLYGFTLLARSRNGLQQEPPGPGDLPQVWVIVDLTNPDVQLTEVTPTPNHKNRQVSIKWRAADKNLMKEPISLFYAEKEDGPWKVIAGNLKNTGLYNWTVPPDTGPYIFVRVEATDMAGNVGRQTSTRVLLDTQVPSLSIIGVETISGR